jgi:hypothetical protein
VAPAPNNRRDGLAECSVEHGGSSLQVVYRKRLGESGTEASDCSPAGSREVDSSILVNMVDPVVMGHPLVKSERVFLSKPGGQVEGDGAIGDQHRVSAVQPSGRGS